jgi:hypothetical protein
MALYDTDYGLMFKFYDEGIQRTVCVEIIRGKPYFVGGYDLYWVDHDEVLSFRLSVRDTLTKEDCFRVCKNPGLIGTRKLLVHQLVIFTVSENYVLRRIQKKSEEFTEFGKPNKNLSLMYINMGVLTDSSNVYVFDDFDFNLYDYNGQDMVVYTYMGFTNKLKPGYNPVNQYISAKYDIDAVIDQNEEYFICEVDGDLVIKNYDQNSPEFVIPNGARLYNIGSTSVKSARM